MAIDDATGRKSTRKPIGVPRRFAVGTALIIVTMYSGLFAVLSWLGVHPVLFVIVAVFFTGVGAAQMLLFRGRKPRAASLVAGALLGSLIPLAGYLIDYLSGRLENVSMVEMIPVLFSFMMYMAIVGIPLGYVAGCLTAGVFLILDRIDRAWNGPRAETEPASGEDEPGRRGQLPWDERWWDRIRKSLAAFRPYRRGRPIRDAVNLFLIVLILVGLAAPFFQWPWWVHLLGTLAAALLLGLLYGGARLCGWKGTLFSGLLGGAGALGPNRLLQHVFFFPDRPLGQYLPSWLVLLFGCLLGFLVLTMVVALRPLCLREERRRARLTLRVVGTTIAVLMVVFGAVSVALLQISKHARQRAFAAIHEHEGDARAAPGYLPWPVEYVAMGASTRDEDIECLSALKELLALSLHGTQITDAGLAHLKGLRQLEHVHLSETRITGAGLRSLHDNKNLSTLVLANSQVTHEGLASLEEFTNLRYLSLAGTRIGDAALVHLKDQRYLLHLDLSGTQVSGAGLVHLTGASNRPAAAPEADSPQAAALEYLKRLVALRHLDLHDTPVTDDALRHIAKMTGLAMLNLANTRVTDAGLVHLKGHPSLTSLDLRGTKITDTGLSSLKTLPSLKRLDLEGTQVSADGVADFGRAVKGRVTVVPP